MPRARPPSLTSLARRLVCDEALFGRGDLVLCAVSGGPDSTALLHVLALLRRRLGHGLAAIGVDHGLRPEAEGELAQARAVAEALDVPFSIARVAVAPGGNLMARARHARHLSLQAEAARLGAACVALGHTADDRAETLLLRLLRGAGPRGLAVMAPRSSSFVGGVDLVRPLVAARRADVELHLRRHELPFSIDPSNADRRFLRVRVRYELIPLLEDLSSGVTEHLCHLADMLLDAPPDDLEALGRAQRLLARRAARSGRTSATVRVSGGRDVLLTFSQKTPVLPDEQ
ncbi:MAG: tRNA lysidine(34) synthetase TilS [Deltaproteobacteria bacterium]|nr:tRNA lysidine(34) synthetase TilS [Deltaproteobacteria bacterium]